MNGKGPALTVSLSLAILLAPPIGAQAPEWTEISVSVGYEAPTEPIGDWRDVTARIEHRWANRLSLYAEGMATERFDLRDSEGRVGFATPIGSSWALNLEGSASPTSRVLAEYSGLFDLYRDLGGGWQISAGGRYREYDTGGVRIGVARTEYYFSSYRAGYALSVGEVDGEYAPAHTLSLSRYFGENSSLNLDAGAGRSVERISPERLLVTRFYTGSVRGSWWPTDYLGITYNAFFQNQSQVFDRRGGRLGVATRF